MQDAPLLVEGVTVIVATTGAVPALTAVKAAISPVPEAARPIDGALFVQENVVLGTAPVKEIAVVEVPLQLTWLETGFTVGAGFTVRFVVTDGRQPGSVGAGDKIA